MLRVAFILTLLYAGAFFACVFDYTTTDQWRVVPRSLVFWASLPVGLFWLLWAFWPAVKSRVTRAAVASCVVPFWWQLIVYLFDALGSASGLPIWEIARAYTARGGLVAMFFIGLLWVIWILERGAEHYRRLEYDAKASAESQEETWNPLNLRAWYYKVTKNPKLDQSFAGFTTYSLLFLLVCLVLSNLNGCREIYELPAGGGEQAQIAQVVKIQKVIRKKFIVNPFSMIAMEVPPIDDVKLDLTEVTRHAYTVGYGEGAGAGFAGGTQKGKVRFIRLEYNGGDWDQDFGIGGDMNMLFEYGIRTNQRVANKTESRRISQLNNFPIGKSPPFVFITGQRSISVSNGDIKTLREYIIDKHGMIFCDNGGSRTFHNQFVSLMGRVLPDVRPVAIPLDDVIHRIPYPIPFLPYVAPHGGKQALGWWQDGRWLAYYHPGDIGDAWSDGNAGVDREVWQACYQLGTNVIFYANSEYSKWLEAREKAN